MELILSCSFGVGFGVAAGLLLIGGGRIAGVSGVITGLIQPGAGGKDFRITFISGLVLSGAVAAMIAPSTMPVARVSPSPDLVIGGLLIGVGARLASGCTSGHGVCGVGRLSHRSLVATFTFFASGVLTLLAMRSW